MLQNGQTTLDGSGPAQKTGADVRDVEDGDPEQQVEESETHVNGHGPSDFLSAFPQINGNGNADFQDYQANGESHTDEPKDVEMD